MTDITKEERDVIEVALEYTSAPVGSKPRTKAWSNLKRAAAVLRASRKPVGRRPEEVEAGGRFRFADKPPVTDCRVIGVVVRVVDEAGPLWRVEGKPNEIYRFHEDDRVIPIQDEEAECEHDWRAAMSPKGGRYMFCMKCPATK